MAPPADNAADLDPPHADSIASNESDSKQPEKKKSKRPSNSAFRQQRLKAWQPILTPKTVLPLFFAIGIIFAPIGGALLFASTQVQMISLDYTDCTTDAPTETFGTMPTSKIDTQFKSSSNASKVDALWMRTPITATFDGVDVPGDIERCSLRFTIPEDMGPPVLFYYQLTNFYQNHRRYVKSFYDMQLKGEVFTNSSVKSSDCDPLRLNADGVAYYPCGLVANSLFNDTFTSPVLLNVPDNSNDNETYYMTESGIAWASDKTLYGSFPSSMNYSEVTPPPNWFNQYPNGYTDTNPPPNLTDNEPFMVWMRTAGLPTFSKLSRRNDTTAMQSGTYQVDVVDFFPVSQFGGTKSIILSTSTVIGGRNNTLGIAYIVVGGICVVLGVLFTISHVVRPRKLGDHTYLSWNNTPGAKQNVDGAASIVTGRDLA